MNSNVLEEPCPATECTPMPEPTVDSDDSTLTGIVELLLKGPERLDELARDEARQAELIPRYLGVVLASFSIFGVALVLLLDAAEPAARPEFLRQRWTGNSPAPAVSLWAAYTLGLVAASGVCLPSFYFFGLLAGVRVFLAAGRRAPHEGQGLHCRHAAWHSADLRGGHAGRHLLAAPAQKVETLLYAGLALPFIAGLSGVWSIYRGFQGLCDTMSLARRTRRACFLRRLTFAWSALYTIVTPVMIYTIWDTLSRLVP